MKPGLTGSDPEVLVVGAGLGGLATGIAAQQAGRSVLVLERSDHLSEVNTGITLWSFAVDALEDLGLRIDRISAPMQRLKSYSAAGAPLSDVDLSATSLGVRSPIEVHRGELQAELLRTLGAGTVRFGARCVSVAEDRVAVTAGTENGETVSAQVLVGADGIHSVVREQIGLATPVRSSGLGFWRGIAEVDQDLVPRGEHWRFYGPGSLFGVARLDDRRVRWYAGGRPSGDWTLAELAVRFADWCHPVPSIVKAGLDHDPVFNNTPRIQPLSRWVGARTALVGDAAHGALPTLGVSGGLAIADGRCLGNALARTLEASTLRDYQHQRRSVGWRVQVEAELFRLLLSPRRPSLVWTRDRLIRPPFDGLQRMMVKHLAHGAVRPFMTELFSGGG